MCKKVFSILLLFCLLCQAGPALSEETPSLVCVSSEQADHITLSIPYKAASGETEHPDSEIPDSDPMDRSMFPESLVEYEPPKQADSATASSFGAPQRQDTVDYQNEVAEKYRSEGIGATPSRRGSTLSISQLRAKYPAGKYWNHANNPGQTNEYNNQNGVTDIPCPANHNDLHNTELQTCNDYCPGDVKFGSQCYGYAAKLGYDATGKDPITSWTKKTYSGALYDLKAGDIVRFLNDTHSIFVIDVEGENVTYTECNENDTCVIRWDKVTTKSELARTFTNVLVCPTDLLTQDEYCHCSSTPAGWYTCTAVSLPVYSRHRLGSTKLGDISGGSSVYVYKASNTIAHVSFNGSMGYTDVRYLSRNDWTNLSINWTRPEFYLTIPNDATRNITISSDRDIPSGCYFSGYYYGSPCKVTWNKWENSRSYSFSMTVQEPGDGVLTISLKDQNNAVISSFDITYRTFVDRTTLSSSNYSVKINGDVTDHQIVSLTAGGYLPDEFSLECLRATNPIIWVDGYGDWNGSSHAVDLQGVYLGDTTLIFGVRCQGVIRATTSINVSVSGTIKITPSRPYVYLNMQGVKKRKMTLKFTGIRPKVFQLIPEPDDNAIVFSSDGDYYELDGSMALDVYVSGNGNHYGSIQLNFIDYDTKKNVGSKKWPVYIWDHTLFKGDLIIPASVKSIDDESFLGIAAKKIRLPNGILSIGAKSFADCPNLSAIYIPSTTKTIDESAFDGDNTLMIYGTADSPAEDFAINHAHWFVPIQ